MSELLAEIEERTGGPVATARLLGVPYTSSYRRWMRGETEAPKYIEQSIRAHMALSDTQFGLLLYLARAEVAEITCKECGHKAPLTKGADVQFKKVRAYQYTCPNCGTRRMIGMSLK